VGTLYNAELAFNEVNDVLYYGKGIGVTSDDATSIIPIAGPGAFVDRISAQSIDGVKSFNSPVSVPDPIDNLDAANKQWVLANSGGGGFAYYYVYNLNLIIPQYRVMITPQLEIEASGSVEIQGVLEIR
jgi:hypothetical protein